MKKISKSDKLDKEEEARIREQLSTAKKSQHFAVGTCVLAPGGSRGKIIARRGEYLTVLWDDGTLTTDRTQALVNNPH